MTRHPPNSPLFPTPPLFRSSSTCLYDEQPDIIRKYTFTTQPFYRADSPLLPSGLLGPVRVVRSEIETRPRSEEHTSELQSRSDLVCRLLLEKKRHITASIAI